MGKALAAWIMMAGAVAAPAMGPRDTVETSATGIRRKYASAKRTTSAAAPIHKMAFDPGNFNFGELV